LGPFVSYEENKVCRIRSLASKCNR